MGEARHAVSSCLSNRRAKTSNGQSIGLLAGAFTLFGENCSFLFHPRWLNERTSDNYAVLQNKFVLSANRQRRSLVFPSALRENGVVRPRFIICKR
ncbi:MAG: hypothetical protein MI923_28535 [Phycisphaerales bacterium]|nr:hypothetical protein [Phycisphaerales bacterium]